MSSENNDRKRKSSGTGNKEDESKKVKNATPKKQTPTSTPQTTPTAAPAANSSSSSTPESKPVKKIQIPGYDELKEGVVWKGQELDFEASVKRMASFVAQYVKHTPQYYYELLSQIFNCKCHLKLENLQMFGDIYVRNCFGIIVGNYLSQKATIKKEFSEVAGFVIVLDPKDTANHHLLDGIALTGLHLKFDAIIYVAPGNLSLLQCVQLHSCHQKGAKVIFHKGDTASCLVRANKHATDMKMIYIEHKFSPQYAMIGAATVAYEMLNESTPLDTIVMPLRLYTVGWSYISGISLYAKLIKPSIRVIVVQMNEDIALGTSTVIFQEPQTDRQPLFPDRAEIGWLSLVQENNILRNVFDKFDARNQGKFTVGDLENIINQMGGDSKRSPPQLEAALSLTEFMKNLDIERMAMLNSMMEEHKQFVDHYTLESLQQSGTIDDIIVVSEDQAVQSFIKCLEYTHTLTNGKGSIALAGLFSGKIQVKKDENVAVLIMGGFVDVIDFQTLFNYGLDLIGQNFEIELDLPDNATALSAVLKVIGEMKASVYEILMDRNGDSLKQYHVRTRIQCRSRNFEQQREVLAAISKIGFDHRGPRGPSTPKMSASTAMNVPTGTFLSVDHFSSSRASLPDPSNINNNNTNNNNNNNNNNNGKESGKDKSAANGKAKSSNKTTQPIRKMEEVTVESIRKAHERIKPNLNHTPIYLSQVYSKLCKCKLYLMLENIQKTGSFKIRGSSNMVIKALESSASKPTGLVAASAGNHAQGVALVSNKVGLPCTIVCPEYAPESKLQWTRNYGAEVIKDGNSLESATKRAEIIGEERDWMLVRPYNDVDVIEGQGTMGCEIYEQIPDIDTVVVNVGGGGMIAGIALYLKSVNPNIRIVGVQSANVAPLADFKTTHVLRYIDPSMLTLADGTNVKLPGGVHTQLLADLVDEYVTVSENEIASTIVHLMENSRTLSEGAGCLGLAALLHHKITVRKDEKVCVVICGGNIDMSTLRQVYEYGLRSLGRLLTIHVSTWDYPGNLAKIIALAAKAELVVREIRHIRGKGDVNWNEVTISLSFYSNSFNHQELFLNLLVEDNLFPKIIGRKYIKEHETIYAAVDKCVELKRKEMEKKHNEHQEQFMTWYRGQYAPVI